MRRIPRTALGAIVALSTVVAVLPAGASSTNLGHVTCEGGTIPSGVYQSLTVAEGALCATGDAADGMIEIRGLLVLRPDSGLDAGEPGTAALWVQNNVVVEEGAILNLGCGGAPARSASAAATDCADHYLNGGLSARDAVAVIVHGIGIRGGIKFEGGGAGVSCAELPGLGFPPYFDIEDSDINGAVHISGVSACWLGLVGNRVRGDVVVEDNAFADSVATEVHGNVVNGAVFCSANSPAAHLGRDAGPTDPSANLARGRGHGECVAPLTERIRPK